MTRQDWADGEKNEESSRSAGTQDAYYNSSTSAYRDYKESKTASSRKTTRKRTAKNKPAKKKANKKR